MPEYCCGIPSGCYGVTFGHNIMLLECPEVKTMPETSSTSGQQIKNNV